MLVRVALPIQSTPNLARLAQVMKPQAETSSTCRRIQRFFAGFAFSYDALGWFLFDLVPSDPPYVAVVDRTEWHFGQTEVSVLIIGIAVGGIAFPIAWTALDHGGGSRADEHADVLEQFLQIVAPEQIRVFVADREFTGGDFWEVIKSRKTPFVIRLKADRRVRPSSEKWSLSVRMFARTCAPDRSHLLEGEQVVGGAESTPVQVATKRLEDGPFLILAARGADPESMFELYRQRWDIETLFAALKSRDFDLEATHLTEPDRIIDRAGPNQKAAWRCCPDLQLDSNCRSGPEKPESTAARVRKRVFGEEPLPLRTGPPQGAAHQLV